MSEFDFLGQQIFSQSIRKHSDDSNFSSISTSIDPLQLDFDTAAFLDGLQDPLLTSVPLAESKSVSTPPPLQQNFSYSTLGDLQSPLSSSSASTGNALSTSSSDFFDVSSLNSSVFSYSADPAYVTAYIGEFSPEFSDPFNGTVSATAATGPVGSNGTINTSELNGTGISLRKSPVLKSQPGDVVGDNIEPYLTVSPSLSLDRDSIQSQLQLQHSTTTTPYQVVPPHRLSLAESLPSTSSSSSTSLTTPSSRSSVSSSSVSASVSPIKNHHGVHSINGKRISDSRLSLAQLAVVLDLSGDVKETSKREKQILSVLREELGFPLGEKTWIRDTPAKERDRFLDELYMRVEERYKYGYSRDTLSVVVRRASYYLMQGRLRRERRLYRKKNGESSLARKVAE
ncbi:DEKNAAC103876 [Brettanomyces naardenensis]|uniref:DEKNAAC103876 n=1 Tax=Brettanomyces naardenensis TaxID=13370 RepID=A0A448YPB9_BRENA|nr:DEKNAAC103876 [Brettanomyces naardenensis]